MGFLELLFDILFDVVWQILIPTRAWPWILAAIAFAIMALVLDEMAWRIVCGGLSAFCLIAALRCLLRGDEG